MSPKASAEAARIADHDDEAGLAIEIDGFSARLVEAWIPTFDVRNRGRADALVEAVRKVETQCEARAVGDRDVKRSLWRRSRLERRVASDDLGAIGERFELVRAVVGRRTTVLGRDGLGNFAKIIDIIDGIDVVSAIGSAAQANRNAAHDMPRMNNARLVII